MSLVTWIKTRWQNIDEEKRAKIVHEGLSIFNTFIAAFLIQIAVDLESAHFAIPADMAALFAFVIAALRAGIKALLQALVILIRGRYSK